MKRLMLLASAASLLGSPAVALAQKAAAPPPTRVQVFEAPG